MAVLNSLSDLDRSSAGGPDGAKVDTDHHDGRARYERARDPFVEQPGGKCLHRLVGREETDDLAIGHVRSELCARLTEEFAGDRSRRRDRFH